MSGYINSLHYENDLAIIEAHFDGVDERLSSFNMKEYVMSIQKNFGPVTDEYLAARQDLLKAIASFRAFSNKMIEVTDGTP